MRHIGSKFLLVTGLAGGFLFWDWISLGYHALGYPTTGSGQAANVSVFNQHAYVTLAEQGLGIYDSSTGRLLRTLSPPLGSGSIDDLAIADGLLFALDARIPGALSVYSLKNPGYPQLVSGPLPAEVGPFSGVSAGGGRVIVSGGTSLLSLRAYRPDGQLETRVVTADLGRGQPDILLSPDGRRALVSSHFSGPRFGLTTLQVPNSDNILIGGALEIEGAGFTEGGSQPANFPIEGAWAGTNALLAYGGGLALIDLENFSEPKLKKIIDVGVKPVNVDMAGNLAAVVGSAPEPMVVLIDIQDLDRPKILRSLPLGRVGLPSGVAIASHQVLVADQSQGISFFPLLPNEKGGNP